MSNRNFFSESVTVIIDGGKTKEQKSKRWCMLLTYQNMTKSQIEELWKKEDLTVLELLMLKYVTSGMKDNKMLVDMIDRHIAKAPTQMELSWPDGWAISIQDLTFDSGK